MKGGRHAASRIARNGQKTSNDVLPNSGPLWPFSGLACFNGIGRNKILRRMNGVATSADHGKGKFAENFTR